MEDTTLNAQMPPRKILVLGAGRFGYIAAERLRKRFPEAEFLVVDHREKRIQKIESELGLPTLTHEAMAYLNETPLTDDQWIIPAIPVHVALLWLQKELSAKGKVEPMPVPSIVDGQLPNPYRTVAGTVYASFATFICPDICSEPHEICTHTGLPRLGSLFEEFGKIQADGFDVEVLRSLQLAPGVGGYPASHLRAILDRISSKAGNYLVATSCRCHGVIDGLRWEPSYH